MSNATAEQIKTNHTANVASTVPVPVEKTGNKGTTAVIEKPKTITTVEKGTGTDAAAPAPKAPPSIRKFKSMEGIPVDKFRGQRKLVVASMIGLAGKFPDRAKTGFTLQEIADNVEGLVSKTPVIDSVKFHLNGLLKDGEIQETTEGLVAPAPAAK